VREAKPGAARLPPVVEPRTSIQDLVTTPCPSSRQRCSPARPLVTSRLVDCLGDPMGDVDRRATQKMAFGNSVNTLLDIYSNCISLLKAFKRRDGSGTSRQEKHEAQLRKSLKEDRAKVRRAYSSAVSERGSRFEHGDGISCFRLICQVIQTNGY
jgi:hypothetical protein